jgi:predicted RecA/RadA family phage recombinase
MAVAMFVQKGDQIDYKPSAAVAAGDVVVQGDLIGIAKQPIEANVLGALAVTGVFDVAKASATVFAVGVKVYWDAANKVCVTADGGGANKLLGKAALAAGAGVTTVRVRLSQ